MTEELSTGNSHTDERSHTDRPNIDYDEVEKFNAIADRWWDPEGEFKPLHEINPLRANFIEQQLNKAGQGSLAEKKVIDVGCGGGILSEAMAYRGAHVTGIDMAESSIKVAQQHAESNNLTIDYQQSTAEAWAASHHEQYDVVTCLEMLEHVPDPSAIVAACAALCKPGGQLIFSTINRNPKSYLFAVLGAEYVLNLIPQGTHDYSKFIRPSELAQWIRQAALTTIESKGIHYNPLTKRFRLVKDVSVNYLMHASKPTA